MKNRFNEQHSHSGYCVGQKELWCKHFFESVVEKWKSDIRHGEYKQSRINRARWFSLAIVFVSFDALNLYECKKIMFCGFDDLYTPLDGNFMPGRL